MTHRCGKYWLGERLAVGGMAEVYLATARGEFGFARRVVVKRLLPHLAERPEVVQLFLDEARLLARLHHPRVVQVLDLGSADGQSYQALEYLDGLDVAALRASGPLAPELALRIVAAVAEGLAYVHVAKGDDGESLGIVHGDVAPGNVVVTRAGEVKLLDFGVARWNKRPDAPRGGTPGFLAPEVEAGAAPDVRSDLFGLGKLLEHLCVPTQLPALARSLLGALTEVDPSARPRSADEAMHILNACLRGLPSRSLANLVRPRMPERRRFPQPQLGPATMVLTAPVRALGSAVALSATLGQQVVHAPAQLAEYARRGIWQKVAIAALLSGLMLGLAGFASGLWVGFRAPSALQTAAGILAGGHARETPAVPVSRASDSPSRSTRRTQAPLRHVRRELPP